MRSGDLQEILCVDVGWICLRIGTSDGFLWTGLWVFGSINLGEFLDWPSDYQLLKITLLRGAIWNSHGRLLLVIPALAPLCGQIFHSDPPHHSLGPCFSCYKTWSSSEAMVPIYKSTVVITQNNTIDIFAMRTSNLIQIFISFYSWLSYSYIRTLVLISAVFICAKCCSWSILKFSSVFCFSIFFNNFTSSLFW